MESSFLGQAAQILQYTSVLRRLLVAISLLLEITPHLYNSFAKFAVQRTQLHLLSSQAKIFADNITFSDPNSLANDQIFY